MQGGARGRAGAYCIVREDAAPKRQRRSASPCVRWPAAHPSSPYGASTFAPYRRPECTPECALSRILCQPRGRLMIISLGPRSPAASMRPDPRTRAGHPFLPEGRTSSYLVLLRAGFTVPPWSPSGRWALTPPFHPYPVRRARRGGLFSVALSVPSRGLRVTERPALRSSDFPLRFDRSDHPARSGVPTHYTKRRRTM